MKVNIRIQFLLSTFLVLLSVLVGMIALTIGLHTRWTDQSKPLEQIYEPIATTFSYDSYDHTATQSW